MMNNIQKLLVFISAGVVLFFQLMVPASAGELYSMNDGKLERPTGYREWVYVGTPVTPNDMNNGKAAFPEFHNVYIDPQSWDHWKNTGEFRDGTILVKELVGVGTKAAVSGNGYFQGDFVGLEATIKSSEHFPAEPGNWAYFSFSTPDHKSLTDSASAFPKEACNACHLASAADDFVFTQHYPVLRMGKAAGAEATGGVTSKLN
ncbi:MAG: cytochrome P460 [Gammaproteobacteria bacterium]|nr:cytochrome P460 [Gammaproteobacteria bacterium]